MTGLQVALALLLVALFLVFLLTLLRSSLSTGPKLPELRGLGLPEGSVRALLAMLVLGGFFIFIFFGVDAVSTERTTTAPKLDADGNVVMDGGTVVMETTVETDTELFRTLLPALTTLTGAVSAFYFATRAAQGNGNGAPGTPVSDGSGDEREPGDVPAIGPNPSG